MRIIQTNKFKTAGKVTHMKPDVTLQFRKKDGDWVDESPASYAVFEHERHLADERAKELNEVHKGKRNRFFWRAKPSAQAEDKGKDHSNKGE